MFVNRFFNFFWKIFRRRRSPFLLLTSRRDQRFLSTPFSCHLVTEMSLCHNALYCTRGYILTGFDSLAFSFLSLHLVHIISWYIGKENRSKVLLLMLILNSKNPCYSDYSGNLKSRVLVTSFPGSPSSKAALCSASLFSCSGQEREREWVPPREKENKVKNACGG